MDDDAALTAAKEALFQRLGEPERKAYWDAFARFVRFEISQPEFDAAARSALGPANVTLHNALVWALLQRAVCSSAASVAEADSTLPYPESMYAAAHMFASEPKRLRSELGSDFAPIGDALSLGDPGSGAALAELSGDGAAPSQPALLSLKIKKDESGNLAATTMGPQHQEVDPAEEAQLNSLQHRLLDLARQHGLTAVQPEGVALMQMAVKAQVHRVLAGGMGIKRREPTGGFAAPAADAKRLGEPQLSAAMKQHAPATWMKPPNQRLGGALTKFVA